MYLFIKLRMLNGNWGRGIWMQNTIFNVWLFIGVMIFSLLLTIIYGICTVSRNSWEGKGATHTQKESMYTMTLIYLSICRFYVYCFIYLHLYIFMQSVLYINLLSRRFAIIMCNIFIVCQQ